VCVLASNKQFENDRAKVHFYHDSQWRLLLDDIDDDEIDNNNDDDNDNDDVRCIQVLVSKVSSPLSVPSWYDSKWHGRQCIL
jgi:hypothetical protein